MIPNFEAIRSELRELFTGTGHEARAYGERIVALLEAIADGVVSEEWMEDRIPWRADLPADTETSVRMIPTTGFAALEVVSVLGPCTVTVNADGRFLFGKQFTAADTLSPNLVLPHGCEVTVVVSGNAARMPINLQFKLRRRKPARRGYAGMESPEVSNRGNVLEPHRHDTPTTFTPNGHG